MPGRVAFIGNVGWAAVGVWGFGFGGGVVLVGVGWLGGGGGAVGQRAAAVCQIAPLLSAEFYTGVLIHESARFYEGAPPASNSYLEFGILLGEHSKGFF